MGGLLPFGSIFIEMYFIFTSFWNYKVPFCSSFRVLIGIFWHTHLGALGRQDCLCQSSTL